jgi:putative transposase
MSERKYKTVKHYHEPGDLHELTFSCYRRITLLTNTAICEKLARTIDAAGEKWRIPLVGFVFMPEHVHLLVRPLDDKPAIDQYLRDVKLPVSVFQKRLLVEHRSPLLQRLTVPSGVDRGQFRFWQEGPGYDRNLQTCPAVRSSLNYIHENPWKRKLVKRIVDWRWSSATYYVSDGVHLDPLLPKITPLPREFWDSEGR